MSRFRAVLMTLLTAVVTVLAMAMMPVGAQASTVAAHAPAAHTPAAHAPAAHAPAARHAATARARQQTPDNAWMKTSRYVCQAPRADRASCLAVARTNVKPHKGVHPDDTPAGYGPADLQSAYDLPSTGGGTGQTVAIVDAYDDPTAEADLGVYRAQYGLPPCTTDNGCFAKVNQDGQASPLPPAAGATGWDVEESLDLDMVSAICPNCHILLVEANSNQDSDLYTAEQAAASSGAKFVSNSWASCEYSGETADDQYFDHPGVVVTAASGDWGYDDEGEGCTQPSYPAASPYVTSVGGTTLTQDSGSARGWTESVWSGTGSGCSSYEAKPGWQTDSGCANRTQTDVSADADPNPGLAVYDSYSEGGWLPVGGTSAATPMIAATYALAGTPAAGSYPASYPYADSSALNDVTSGSNGTCTPAYLCNAGPGYDGPTGLGTPDGVAAFSAASYGTVSGQVTTKSGQPIAGAAVTATGGFRGTTDASGHYSLSAPAGTYDLTATAFGYRAKTVTGVQVTAGQTDSQSFTLPRAPDRVLSGTVTDGSGHHWPLYASITISGYPGSAVYTNPQTGAYSVSLPAGSSYQLSVTPVYQGYASATSTVHIGTSDVTRNFKIAVDQSACDAPGYAFKDTGTTEAFTGWTGTTPQDGWTNVDNVGSGTVWNFGFDNNSDSEPPGSDGQFAYMDYEGDTPVDASLVSPVMNFSGQKAPAEVSFDTRLYAEAETADVDVSTDGGQTWTTDWSQPSTGFGQGPVTVPLPQATGQSDVRVRFRDFGTYGPYWGIDNVFIGTQVCKPTRTGLVIGTVTDANTRSPLNGATVTAAGQSAVSAPTPGDPNLADGFYWIAVPSGSSPVTVTDGNYQPVTQTVAVTANAANHQDWPLAAGNLAVSPGNVTVSQQLGAGSVSRTVKFTNSGTAPVKVQLAEQDGGVTPMTAQARTTGIPLKKVKGQYSFAAPGVRAGSRAGHQAAAGHQAVAGKAAGHIPLTQPGPADAPWAGIADYPTPVMDNAVGYDPTTGQVYSVAGFNGSATLASSYVYDPASQQWTAIADAPQPLDNAGGAFLDGKMYVLGGWNAAGNNVSTLYAYDPASNSWEQDANMPSGVAAAAVTTLNGDLYVVGGCADSSCTGADTTYRYDPASNTWTQLASYPQFAAYAACGGMDGELVCAGGVVPEDYETLNNTYIYDPATNTWSQGADMPYEDWAMSYSDAGNQLQVVGGVVDGFSTVTNQALAYDPSTNTWSALPNANNAEYRGGGTCGLYQIGGSSANFAAQPSSQVLPGYNVCGSQDVPWLSESTDTFTLAPGQAQSVKVSVDSSSLGQPGSYLADLAISTDSPYEFSPLDVTLQASPPATWGKITGTVTDAATGQPIGGASVQICTMFVKSTQQCGPVTYDLTTDLDGNYQLWLSQGYNPLQVIASDSGYGPMLKVVKVTQGTTTTQNFTLTKATQ